MRSRFVGLLVVACATAWAAPGRAEDPSPLAEVLASAPNVVRGKAIDSYVNDHFTYTRFAVTQVIKGDVPKGTALIRQPGAGEEGSDLWQPGAEAVVLLDARDAADKSYPITDFPGGRYRVVAADGEVRVLVNEMGVDTLYLSPKDKRPRSEDAPMDLAEFVRIAHGEPADEAGPPRPAPSALPSRRDAGVFVGLGPVRPAPPTPAVPPEAAARPWWWFVVAAGVVALVALRFVMRRRGA